MSHLQDQIDALLPDNMVGDVVVADVRASFVILTDDLHLKDQFEIDIQVEVDANTTAVGDHETRITSLEGAGPFATTAYVDAADLILQNQVTQNTSDIGSKADQTDLNIIINDVSNNTIAIVTLDTDLDQAELDIIANADAIQINTDADVLVEARVTQNELDLIQFQNNGADLTPIGTMAMWSTDSAPSGWLICDGQLVDSVANTALAELVELLNPSQTTANLPDLRGEFARGSDNGRGVDVGRLINTTQSDQVGDHLHEVAGGTAGGAGTTGVNSASTTETRPRNVSVNYIMKAFVVVAIIPPATAPLGAMARFDGSQWVSTISITVEDDGTIRVSDKLIVEGDFNSLQFFNPLASADNGKWTVSVGEAVWSLQRLDDAEVLLNTAVSYYRDGIFPAGRTDSSHWFQGTGNPAGQWDLAQWNVYELGLGHTTFASNSDGSSHIANNAYNDGTDWRYASDGVAALWSINPDGTVQQRFSIAGTTGNVITWVVAFRTDASGILRDPADIPYVSDLTGLALTPADIGVTVEAFDATILKDADIGSTLQAWSAILDSTDAVFNSAKDVQLSDTLPSGSIGVSVQAFTAILQATTASFTTALNNAYDTHLADTNNPHGVTKGDVGLSLVDNQSAATIQSGTTKSDVGLSLVDNQSAASIQSGTTAANVGLGSVDNTSDVDKPISTDTQTALDAKEDVGAGGGGVNKNLLMNGAFQIWQRTLGPFDNITVGKTFTADRWNINASGGGNVDINGIVNDEKLSSLAFEMSGNVLASGVNLSQRIESFDSAHAANKQLTISVRCRTSAATNLQFILRHANAIDDFSTVTTIQSSNVNVTAGGNVWETLSFTFNTIPPNSANGLEIILQFNTLGAKVAVVTNVKLEIGTSVTAFEHVQQAEVLSQCSRYFQRVSAVEAIGTVVPFGIGHCIGSTTGAVAMMWIKKRIVPTVAANVVNQLALTTLAGTTSVLNGFNLGGSVISLDSGFILCTIVSTQLVAGDGTLLVSNENNTAYIDIDAELV